jgi:hypothetical protein
MSAETRFRTDIKANSNIRRIAFLFTGTTGQIHRKQTPKFKLNIIVERKRGLYASC